MISEIDDLVVVDVETTGINPFKHDILSLALVPIMGDRPPFEIFIEVENPTWQATARQYFQSSWVTWRNTGRSASAVCSALESYIQEHYGRRITLIGHNIGFDVAFLRQLAFRAGRDELPLVSHRFVDTHSLLFLLHILGAIPKEALSSSGAFDHFGITPAAGSRHTALGDARATRELFVQIVSMFRGAPTTRKISPQP